MRTIFIYAFQILVCSGVLTALYALLLERKVSFRFARLYLLLSAVVAVVIPLLNIPVWEPEQLQQLGGVAVGALTGQVVAEQTTSFDYRTLLWAVYGVGVLISLVGMVLQLLHIARIRRSGVVTELQGVTIVRSKEQIASFSFLSTIFIGGDTAEEDLPTIIAHERSHIAHNHTAERLAMEMMKALLWWNPFVWISARQLVEVQEFEADNDVIRSGCDAKIYVTTLLKHLFGYSPEIANGLHNSLTKKRLKMILKNNSGRYALLRKLTVIPVLGILFALFALTTKQAVATPVEPDVATVKTEIDGYDSFRDWVMMNICYPEQAKSQKIEGTVIVNFAVGTDGGLKNVKALRSPNQSLTDEVLRVVGKAPSWKPILKDGKAVEVSFMLPVAFLLGDKQLPSTGEIVVKSY
ncbi:MAG: M56 family metallopeptidase [Alistipes sp.]|nr:M56 family metallopeptidase [Alistipes sp.]